MPSRDTFLQVTMCLVIFASARTDGWLWSAAAQHHADASTATRNLLGSTYSVYLSVITYLSILLLHTVLGPDVYEKYEGNKLFVFYASRASPFYKCIIIFSWKDALCLFKAAKTSMSRLWQHHSIPFRRSYFIRHIIIYSPIFDQPVAGCRSVAVDFSCILQ